MTYPYAEVAYKCKSQYAVPVIHKPSGDGQYAAMTFTANLKRLRRGKGWQQEAQRAEQSGREQCRTMLMEAIEAKDYEKAKWLANLC